MRIQSDPCDLSLKTDSFNCLLPLQERTAVLSDLAEKAKLTEQLFNTVPGITCNPVQGAMYTFPRITLPQKAIDRAKVRTTLIHEHHPDFIHLCGCAQICVCPSAGGRLCPRHVLLYEAAGRRGYLPGAR